MLADAGKTAPAQMILVKIWKKALEMGLEGDLGYIKEIGDRLDGRAAQSISVGNDPDNPFIVEVRYTVVDPTA